MLWSFAEHTLEENVWRSKDELEAFLSRCTAGNILLGENTESIRNFYSVTVHVGWSSSEHFGIGLCSEGHGLVPHVLMQPQHSTIVLGFNSEAVAIDINSRNIKFALSLESLFRCFVPMKQFARVLVFHEIGVTCINESGKEIWRYSNDVITNCHIEEASLKLHFMDAKPVSLEILTGQAESVA